MRYHAYRHWNPLPSHSRSWLYRMQQGVLRENQYSMIGLRTGVLVRLKVLKQDKRAIVTATAKAQATPENFHSLQRATYTNAA
ncbi:hypothetical protein RU07_11700 [Agrobacterium tumefaciens]|uniref:Uncharacterized protein n=1 Tax=Agrobacterium tumefaciens TaxID=358 RepID=A0A0D0K2A0_AGRTU|nr:hypothetical protein RU07_11700 [Agrobacterium tumefaciens]